MIIDYKINDFKKESDEDGKVRYYFKCHGEFIEVTKEVYDTCMKSYNKMKYDHKRDVAILKTYYDFYDYGTSSFVFNNEVISIVDMIFINDIINLLNETINMLPEQDYIIAKGIYIHGFSERDIANYLCLSPSTIHYQKIRIKFYLQEVVIDFIGIKQDLK
ncbi:MAG: hypothetical protein LUG60_01610 [Erysipelotrichaceae bacterium]|nr:hypothetical protein [Erysipelotrichaceae bacterium]